MMICKYIEIARCKWNDDQVQLLLIQKGFLRKLILNEFFEGWCYDLVKFRIYVVKVEKIVLVNYHKEECPYF